MSIIRLLEDAQLFLIFPNEIRISIVTMLSEEGLQRCPVFLTQFRCPERDGSFVALLKQKTEIL
jgi:hypothetical protein